MTVAEAVKENLAAMEAAGVSIAFDDVLPSDMEEFGGLEILSRRSQRGKKGRVFTVFQTTKGEVGFWPLASMGPVLGWYKKGKS